ncbi:hypothetical protein IFM89_026114 [Coptis chinensis]|uniref:Prohibitin n=1 Tax=Coptis chinensis TaxID=261450 RepID=A0A835M6L2_9MAGN|nr:hypothetical protein IFM89_026114 [Coptis chinensis]
MCLFDRFRGVLDTTVGEGTHFKIPWLQMPHIFNIKSKPHVFTSSSPTKDLQTVSLTLRVLSRPEVSKLPTIFKTLGVEYENKVLPSIGNEVLKAVVAQFEAEQLLREGLVLRAKCLHWYVKGSYFVLRTLILCWRMLR